MHIYLLVHPAFEPIVTVKRRFHSCPNLHFTSHWPPSWFPYQLLETCWAFPVGIHRGRKETKKKTLWSQYCCKLNILHTHAQQAEIHKWHTNDTQMTMKMTMAHTHTSILAAADSTAAEVAAISCSTRSPSSPCCSSKPRGRSFWTQTNQERLKSVLKQKPHWDNVTFYRGQTDVCCHFVSRDASTCFIFTASEHKHSFVCIKHGPLPWPGWPPETPLACCRPLQWRRPAASSDRAEPELRPRTPWRSLTGLARTETRTAANILLFTPYFLWRYSIMSSISSNV